MHYNVIRKQPNIKANGEQQKAGCKAFSDKAHKARKKGIQRESITMDASQLMKQGTQRERAASNLRNARYTK